MLDAIFGITSAIIVIGIFGHVTAEAIWPDQWPLSGESDLARFGKAVVCGVGLLVLLLVLIMVTEDMGDARGRHHPDAGLPGPHYTER